MEHVDLRFNAQKCRAAHIMHHHSRNKNWCIATNAKIIGSRIEISKITAQETYMVVHLHSDGKSEIQIDFEALINFIWNRKINLGTSGGT